MKELQTRENKMGTMPVNRLLLSMSLPMIISMIVQALYNVVDSIFVSFISENALTAVSMAFPIQNLMISVGAGLGVGINALLSRSLGEKNQEKANQTAVQGIFLVAISFLLFLMFGVFGSSAFMHSQTNISEILESGTIYLTICSSLSFAIFGQMTFERLLQSTGRTMYTMITQGTGAVINIILDPILIFGYLGFPKLGVAGAAIATVFGQFVAFLLAVFFNLRKNTDIQISFRGFRPHARILKEILAVGIPSIIMQAISSVMTFGMNKILFRFSPTAVAVFGAYFKLQSFVFMPVFGLNNGMVPIIAYNYGAGKRDRLIKTIKLSIAYAVGIMLAGLITIQLIPGSLLGMFNASPQMLEIGIPALRIISLSFVFAGYCIITSSVFQALGNGIYSMIVSIVRQIVILLPVAYLFSKTGVLSAVWLAFPIAELASLTLCTMFLLRINKNVIHKIN
ncbi:MATE family efflux transporter [Ruminococcus gauvreauii]|uniref:Probable multidrug resistance protein NorM n=1 Tax=Ruminococcus gauvreauii TaxID=438033 RepID=A0ABY5VK20_9FIRM|nr:MATE family efflux transporter [Ruminococcus gauvreauii]UWP60398.1 MATE family efflux transporter [Ruminococcus gauvreauii]